MLSLRGALSEMLGNTRQAKRFLQWSSDKEPNTTGCFYLTLMFDVCPKETGVVEDWEGERQYNSSGRPMMKLAVSADWDQYIFIQLYSRVHPTSNLTPLSFTPKPGTLS